MVVMVVNEMFDYFRLLKAVFPRTNVLLTEVLFIRLVSMVGLLDRFVGLDLH